MRQLFIDTGILVGAVSPKDALHAESRAVLDRIADREWERVHTSDFVVAEAFNFVARKIKRKQSADALSDLVFGSSESPALVSSVLRIHGARLAAALEQYRSRFSAGLTLTDWTSIVAMKELSIGELATFDNPLRGFVKVVP